MLPDYYQALCMNVVAGTPKQHKCRSMGCDSNVDSAADFCDGCIEAINKKQAEFTKPQVEVLACSGNLTAAYTAAYKPETKPTMSEQYPAYYKSVAHLKEVDVYAVHHLFNVVDPSGCIPHASKKLLLSGVRTGNKSKYSDIREARDTLNRWLELNHPE